MAPYVYFFLAGDDGHGNQYPGWVIMVVIGLVLATFLLEGGRSAWSPSSSSQAGGSCSPECCARSAGRNPLRQRRRPD